MKNRATLTLVVFLFLSSVNIGSLTSAVYARSNDGVHELTATPATAASSTTHDQDKKHIPFEPLLLLLLGSALFSIGTAIKLLLARKFQPQAQPAARGKTTTRPGLVG